MFGRAAGEQACPFCSGNEQMTPPEVDAIRAADTAPNQPGWRHRVVPNLYPATAHHEVITEGPVHAVQPAALDVALWRDALTLYWRRIAHIEAQPGVRCAYLFKNVGRRAGASIAHNHSQVLGLPMLPPRLELELANSRDRATCAHCDEITTAEGDGRVVVAGEHHVALCPRAPKLPFETWLLPRDHDADFLAHQHATDLAQVLHGLFGAIDRAFEDAPFNLFLHRIPGAAFHWHWELQPRTGNVAGLELGGDMYINSISGADAAARIRGDSR